MLAWIQTCTSRTRFITNISKYEHPMLLHKCIYKRTVQTQSTSTKIVIPSGVPPSHTINIFFCCRRCALFQFQFPGRSPWKLMFNKAFPDTFPILGCSRWNLKLDKAFPYIQVSDSRVFPLDSEGCSVCFFGVRLGTSIWWNSYHLLDFSFCRVFAFESKTCYVCFSGVRFGNRFIKMLFLTFKFPILGCSTWNWKLDQAFPHIQVSRSRVFALESEAWYVCFSGVRLGIRILWNSCHLLNFFIFGWSPWNRKFVMSVFRVFALEADV